MQVGCWRPEHVKWKVRWHGGGSGDKRVGSGKASLWRPSRGPPCRPPLCHPVDEGQLREYTLSSQSVPKKYVSCSKDTIVLITLSAIKKTKLHFSYWQLAYLVMLFILQLMHTAR